MNSKASISSSLSVAVKMMRYYIFLHPRVHCPKTNADERILNVWSVIYLRKALT